MSTSPKLLGFTGSTRKESFNEKLVKIALLGSEKAGASVTFVDLKQLEMPLFDQDLEAAQGLPSSVMAWKALLKEHQGFLVASPEYNSSLTPLLKNAIDWASRSEPGEPPLALSCFKGKVAAILATSPGGMGGLRGLVHLRSILQNIGVIVIPDQKALPNALQIFDEAGNLKESRQQEAVEAIGKRLAEVTAKLNA